MDPKRSFIFDHYDKIVHEIDIYTESILERVSSCYHEEVNLNRQTLFNQLEISKNFNLATYESNKTQICQLKNSDEIKTNIFDKMFCFFIHTRECQSNRKPGKLVIVNHFLTENQVEQIRKLFTNELRPGEIDKDIENHLSIKIIHNLINQNKNLDIIDLSDPSKNELKILFLLDNFNNVNETSLSVLNDLINLDKLKRLELAFDSLEVVYSKWFENLHSLEQIFLGGDSLKKLQNENFKSLTNLGIIFLCNTPLELIEEEAFKGLDNLKKITFTWGAFNRLKSLKINYLASLESFEFQKNKIDLITKSTFECHNLKQIIMNENHIQLIEDEGFGNLENLEEISIINNEAKMVIKEKAFSGLKSLEILNLLNTKIDWNENRFLIHLGQIKLLSLCQSLNETISLDFLNNFKNLEVLDLRQRKKIDLNLNQVYLPNLKYLLLDSMPRLNNFPSIQALVVSNLDTFETNLFEGVENLKYLEFEFENGNILDQLNESHFSGLKNMNWIELKFKFFGNTFNLNENLKKIIENLFDKCSLDTKWLTQDFNSELIFEANGGVSKNDFFEKILQVSKNVRQYVTESYLF